MRRIISLVCCSNLDDLLATLRALRTLRLWLASGLWVTPPLPDALLPPPSLPEARPRLPCIGERLCNRYFEPGVEPRDDVESPWLLLTPGSGLAAASGDAAVAVALPRRRPPAMGSRRLGLPSTTPRAGDKPATGDLAGVSASFGSELDFDAAAGEVSTCCLASCRALSGVGDHSAGLPIDDAGGSPFTGDTSTCNTPSDGSPAAPPDAPLPASVPSLGCRHLGVARRARGAPVSTLRPGVGGSKAPPARGVDRRPAPSLSLVALAEPGAAGRLVA